MATVVIRDFEQDVATLIEPETEHSFGPVVSGVEGHRTLLEFVVNCPVDPALLPEWELRGLWDAYVDAVERGVDIGTASQEPEDDGAVRDTAPEEALARALGVTGAVAYRDEEVEDTDTPRPPTRTRTCPECDGFRTVARDAQEIPCPECNGVGTVALAE